MEDRLTVLVLGAGASAPYGFPLGLALVDHICESFPANIAAIVGERFPLEVAQHRARQFASRLRNSRRYSIDAFLEHNKDVWRDGKVAIAQALLGREQPAALDAPKDKGLDWYRYFFNALADGPLESFASKPLGIITYNYDRSLEYYLTAALQDSYNISEAEAAAQVRRIPIVHVHGRLGRLGGWPGEDTEVPFGPGDCPNYRSLVLDAADGIRVVYEDMTGNLALEEAHGLLQRAGKLIFLGFGYDRVNLERLRLGEMLPEGILIEGTGHGLTDTQRETVQGRLSRMAGSSGRQHYCQVHDMHCLELLRDMSLF